MPHRPNSSNRKAPGRVNPLSAWGGAQSRSQCSGAARHHMRRSSGPCRRCHLCTPCPAPTPPLPHSLTGVQLQLGDLLLQAAQHGAGAVQVGRDVGHAGLAVCSAVQCSAVHRVCVCVGGGRRVRDTAGRAGMGGRAVHLSPLSRLTLDQFQPNAQAAAASHRSSSTAPCSPSSLNTLTGASPLLAATSAAVPASSIAPASAAAGRLKDIESLQTCCARCVWGGAGGQGGQGTEVQSHHIRKHTHTYRTWISTSTHTHERTCTHMNTHTPPRCVPHRRSAPRRSTGC